MTPTPAHPTATLAALKQAAVETHDLWKQHAYIDCWRCLSGLRCYEGRRLCDEADTAGLKVERALSATTLRATEAAREAGVAWG